MTEQVFGWVCGLSLQGVPTTDVAPKRIGACHTQPIPSVEELALPGMPGEAKADIWVAEEKGDNIS